MTWCLSGEETVIDSQPLSLDQLGQRLPAVDEVVRTTRQVGDGRLVGVDAHVAVERGVHLAEVDRPINRFRRVLVRCTDDLAGAHPAARDKRAGDFGPVVPSALAVDLRRAAELAPGDVEIYRPRLAVIIGRSADFRDEFDRQRLSSDNPDVEIVTYDDILAFAKRRRLLIEGKL